jgi:hypothetical protein
LLASHIVIMAGLIDVSSLTTVAKNNDGLLEQPAEPKFKTALIQIYVPSQEGGGSDKISSGHRYDSIPIANGFIKAGASCQLINYTPAEHDKFFEVVKQFDAIIVRCNPGQIKASGGDQAAFDASMMKVSESIPVWPTADVMSKMGAKDALCQIKDMDLGLPDTLGYYSPDDIKAGFRKTIAFQPRVVKQNRGSSGEGIWIIKLKSNEYCEHYGDKWADDSEMLVLTEANDSHVEEHTVGEFLEWCINGRTDASGTWTSKGVGKYFEGGVEAGGQMVDQRFLPRIDEGEARFMMISTELYKIEHYVYVGGVGGETKTTIYPPDAPEYAAIKAKLEGDVPTIMKKLGLSMDNLPLLWAADLIPVDDHASPLVVGEFNCSCLGIAGFLDARGKDLSVVTKENAEEGQKMCDLIGKKGVEVLENRKK